MAELNEWGVDMATVVPGVRVRFDGAGEPAMGTVERMDTPRVGRVRLYDPLGGFTGESAIFHAYNVTGVGLVCDVDGPFPAPSWALDYPDFPTGWHLQRQGVIHVDRMCSAVQAWGALLCDCGALETEWKRRRALMGRSA